MFIFSIQNTAHGFDPLILLLLALGIEGYLGNPFQRIKFIRHPVVIIGAFISLMERKLNRETRSDMDRAVRGFVLVFLTVGICGVVGWGLAWLTQNHVFGWVIELILVVMLLAQKSLYDHVRAVGKALDTGSLEDARTAVSHIVGRDPAYLDEHGIARAAIESLAENFSDGIIAPVFWYVLFGLPGMLVYKAINTMDSMIGHKNERYRAFGMTAARLDDVVNLIPARLAGLFIVFAAFFAGSAHPLRAFKIMWRDASKHRSPNAGWPEGAMAGALDLALAGPRKYQAHVVQDPWVGDGRARAVERDIAKALYLYLIACLINAVWVGAIAMLRFSL